MMVVASGMYGLLLWIWVWLMVGCAFELSSFWSLRI
jgi:hypothetical protein